MVRAIGLTIGTDTAPWHYGQKIANPFPNPTVSRTPPITKDPGAMPSLAGACAGRATAATTPSIPDRRHQQRHWGYNNLQWHGFTYLPQVQRAVAHRFEAYYLTGDMVLNAQEPRGPRDLQQRLRRSRRKTYRFNPPNLAHCGNTYAPNCTARMFTGLFYINYSPDPLNNISLRAANGMTIYGLAHGTAVKTIMSRAGLGWQHWLSPQIEFRPEVVYWRSLDTNAFNGNPIAGIPANKNYTVLGAMDAIIHF